MKKSLLLLFTTLAVVACNHHHNPQTFLVVLAHPDDETTIGAMMAHYSGASKIRYVVATDGRYGTRIKKIATDTLIDIRQKECACSCKALGIGPPDMLGFHDGFGTATGIGEYFKQIKAFKEKIKTVIEEVNPDVIITFGPDGDSGHADHRIVGDVVTEVILREGWVNQYPLYYLGWTKAQAAKFGIDELGYLDSAYFNLSVHFTEEDEARSFQSIRCYQSQNTAQEIEEWISAEKLDRSNVLYFRKFGIAAGRADTF